ncbi:hemin uptake protein HemP [uncultured Aquincola sp.]|uniref:hemin uptake protein HemP n=1 Tax=uncultured Aquincola sp. TaxID=886556 RepID=UPI0032B18B87|tara:strand:- start:475 stop:684 length:210 start_codon:yes stop_codon:yes gene_type:complete
MQHHLTPVPSPFRADTGSAAHHHLAPQSVPPRTLTSRTLLDGANEVQIEHYGSVYRLRLTALGKLILTK